MFCNRGIHNKRPILRLTPCESSGRETPANMGRTLRNPESGLDRLLLLGASRIRFPKGTPQTGTPERLKPHRQRGDIWRRKLRQAPRTCKGRFFSTPTTFLRRPRQADAPTHLRVRAAPRALAPPHHPPLPELRIYIHKY